MYAESFPSKLKAARDKTGLSQRDVAKELNISQPTITNYETGRTQPDIETLGISMYQILPHEDKKGNYPHNLQDKTADLILNRFLTLQS